jgi:NAD-dependent dihydropyrimidine dehydrogenase PreA subunit
MEAAGKYYQNIGTDSYTVPFGKYGHDTLSVSKAIIDADIVISLPKFKTHGLTVISGAIKNSYGILPGAQKARLHKAAGSPEKFHELIVDVFKLRIPDLFIVDGVVGMEGNGPASPDLRDVGIILASDNAVAVDSVIASMMGCNPEKLGFLRKAKEYAIGDFDLSRIEITGDFKTIPDYKIPPLGGDAMYNNQSLQDMMQKRTMLLPKADPLLCTGCGQCVDHCPVSALFMNGATPDLIYGKCITCFCCQEICPVKAISLV